MQKGETVPFDDDNLIWKKKKIVRIVKTVKRKMGKNKVQLKMMTMKENIRKKMSTRSGSTFHPARGILSELISRFFLTAKGNCVLYCWQSSYGGKA